MDVGDKLMQVTNRGVQHRVRDRDRDGVRDMVR